MDKLPYRTGFGYDIHQLKAGRKLILGGVEIPSYIGLEGHSDADVLIHALADAILGACGLKDIGYYFPNTDKSIEGIDSRIILKKAADLALEKGYRLGNIDCTLIAERPKISPYIDSMKESLSNTLGIPTDHIGIKATTNETLGSIGRAEGMAAHAICLLILES